MTYGFNLSNKQDYKNMLMLRRSNLIARSNNIKDPIKRNDYIRLIRITDFLMSAIEQFKLEELEDICKIYLVADIAHDDFREEKVEKGRQEHEAQLLSELLDQTEMILEGIHGYEKMNQSPSDMIRRNRIQLNRLQISIYEAIKLNETNLQSNDLYRVVLEQLKKILSYTMELKDELNSINKPNIEHINKLESDIYKLSIIFKELSIETITKTDKELEEFSIRI